MVKTVELNKSGESEALAIGRPSLTLPILSIVIPAFNEELVIGETAKRLSALVDNLIQQSVVHSSSFICFVDDGSTDLTWSIISSLHDQDEKIKGVKLSKNEGHQFALLAGLLSARQQADVIITIDADLQQDESAIYEFLDKYKNGYEIVFGVRRDRGTDGTIKKLTALLFYKIMNLMGVDIIKNHADYRLVGKKALEALSNFDEVNLFLRGVFPILGFKSTTVWFDVRERLAGETKYSFKKMLAFALEGITSFSILPLRFITAIGFSISLFSFFMGSYTIIARFFGKTVSGWASIVLPVYFLGGIQLFGLGLLGEYVGKTYKEVKRRPRYIIEEQLF